MKIALIGYKPVFTGTVIEHTHTERHLDNNTQSRTDNKILKEVEEILSNPKAKKLTLQTLLI